MTVVDVFVLATIMSQVARSRSLRLAWAIVSVVGGALVLYQMVIARA